MKRVKCSNRFSEKFESKKLKFKTFQKSIHPGAPILSPRGFLGQFGFQPNLGGKIYSTVGDDNEPKGWNLVVLGLKG